MAVAPRPQVVDVANLLHAVAPGRDECELCGLTHAAHRQHAVGYRCYGYWNPVVNTPAQPTGVQGQRSES